jgi:threonyl-tRNA synthetase
MAKADKNDQIQKVRHSLSHILAEAVLQIFPEAKLGIGPATDDGFYYDFELPRTLIPEDLPLLEKKMHEILSHDHDFVYSEQSIEAAEEWAHSNGQNLKAELIAEIAAGKRGASEKATFYTDGPFTDLCAGPHVAKQSEIPEHFRLTRIAGAYWKGDESRPMLQRIYGVAFETKKELDDYFSRLEEAEKRDHKKLGPALDLFTFSPLVGAGLPLFTPRGTVIRRVLEQYLHELQLPRGFELVTIPHLGKSELYKTSGHWDKFKDDLFHVKGKSEEFVLKPMNCPHHIQIFAAKPRSYRDLPVRYAEVTMQYRDEQSGELQGLTRVRSISIDDGHVFARPDQIEEEALRIYEIISEFYKTFGMKLRVRLSFHDPDNKQAYLGSDEIWKAAESALRTVSKKFKEEVFEGIGEATFYGPKLDFMATDALGREWQLATVQLDFNLPERFKLTYTDSDGSDKRPVMIHRAILGSFERFMAILIEHYAGSFPLWLAPEQVRILTISEEQTKFAETVLEDLRKAGLRATLDDRNESVGRKIRDAEQLKVPVMLVIGKNEVSDESATIRRHGSSEQKTLKLSTIAKELAAESLNRS